MLDITTLATWGEFLGGIAVVVSLVYFVSRSRLNRNRAARRISRPRSTMDGPRLAADMSGTGLGGKGC